MADAQRQRIGRQRSQQSARGVFTSRESQGMYLEAQKGISDLALGNASILPL